jgi:hypothetical protein
MVALTGIEKVKPHFKGAQHVLSCSFYVQASLRFCLLCAYKLLRCDPGVTRKLVQGGFPQGRDDIGLSTKKIRKCSTRKTSFRAAKNGFTQSLPSEKLAESLDWVISDARSRGGIQAEHYTTDRPRRPGNRRRSLEEPACANVLPHPSCTQACFARCLLTKRRSLFL